MTVEEDRHFHTSRRKNLKSHHTTVLFHIEVGKWKVTSVAEAKLHEMKAYGGVEAENSTHS
jgi:hypothetical protein